MLPRQRRRTLPRQPTTHTSRPAGTSAHSHTGRRKWNAASAGSTCRRARRRACPSRRSSARRCQPRRSVENTAISSW